MDSLTELVMPTFERYVAALNGAGARRYVLAAELALGLARDGHLTDVKFTLADRPGAFEAFRSAVEAYASRAAQGNQVSPEAGDDTPDANQSVRKRAPAILAKGSDATENALETDARGCGSCGASFRVNPRHATAHRYCSPACRSRARRTFEAASGRQRAGGVLDS